MDLLLLFKYLNIPNRGFYTPLVLGGRLQKACFVGHLCVGCACMKIASTGLAVGLGALLFWSCAPQDSGSSGEGAESPVEVISTKDLAPHDGLFYNKKTNKPFTGRVDEFFLMQGSPKVRVSRHMQEGRLHGLRTQYFNDGKKFIEIEYEDGLKHGRAFNWHRNGEVQWERHFKKDQLDGESIRYDADGNITQHVIYKMGRVEKAIK